MIPQEMWISQHISAEDAKSLITKKIQNFLIDIRKNSENINNIDHKMVPVEQSLFSLNPSGGRLGHFKADREALELAGIEAMESFGMKRDQFHIDERERELNKEGKRVVLNGAKEYLIFTCPIHPQIEFSREATYVRSDENSDNQHGMYVNNVKWSVRYATDPLHVDNTHP